MPRPPVRVLRFRTPSLRIRLEARPDFGVDRLFELFDSFEPDDDPAPPDVVYRLEARLSRRRGHSGSSVDVPFELCTDIVGQPDTVRRIYHGLGVLAAEVTQETNRRHLDHDPGRLHLHAAGLVDGDGRAALFVAASGSGKSTLAVHLVRHGFGYLGDEMLALDGRRVHAYPKPITLKPGSWPVVPEVHRSLDEPPDRARTHRWEVTPNAIRAGSVVVEAVPALVVFPRFTPDSGGIGLVPVHPADAVVEMVGSLFDFERYGPGALALLADLAAAAPAHRLTYDTLDGIEDLVTELLAAGPAPFVVRHLPVGGPAGGGCRRLVEGYEVAGRVVAATGAGEVVALSTTASAVFAGAIDGPDGPSGPDRAADLTSLVGAGLVAPDGALVPTAAEYPADEP